MSNSTDWMHFYRHNVSGQPQNTPSFNGSVSESVTAAAASVATEAAQSNLSRTYSNSNMNGGRASRPLRRRPRASKRTPIVLLNTDTSNFRAMVQQFTGGPSFASRTEYSNGVNSGFGVGTEQSMNPSTAMAPSGFQVQFQRQQLQYLHQRPHIFISLNNNIQGDDAAFLLKFRPNKEVEASSCFVNNGGSAHVPPSDGSTAVVASTNEKRGVHNSYMEFGNDI